jgi:hypothetical protein
VGQSKLTPIKEFLGEEYGFTEIRYVIADMTATKVEEPEMAYGPSAGSIHLA